jgi:hypothetical protein
MNDMPDMEQIGKIINAVKTARALGDIMQSETSKQAEQPPKAQIHSHDICTFDKELQSPEISSIKAAIPYLDSRYQKNMGIIVKLMELDRLLHHYTVIATENGEDKSKQMLTAIKAELPEPNKAVADLLIKVIEIKNITNTLKEMELN